MKSRIVNIPAGGVATPILATQLDRQCNIVESSFTASNGANTPGGISYALPGDNFAQYYPLNAGDTLVLGDTAGIQGPYGAVIGNGPQVILGVGPTAGTTLCMIKSTGGTSVQVNEQA